MLFLLLAILSSSVIALFMRISSRHVRANLSMLCVNYLICAFLGAAYASFAPLQPEHAFFPNTLFMGFVTGILYLGGFVLFQYNTRKKGMVISSIFMKLGLLVPMAVSVFAFREAPSLSQITGFFVAVFAIVLINLKGAGEAGGFGLSLILMLLFCGGCDAMAKVFERLGPPELENAFLFWGFAFAFLFCLGLVLYKKERPGVSELLFGSLVGVPNFFSSKFLLGALTELPAVVVYPSFSVGTLLIVTLLGVALFHEKLQKRQWLALVLILTALVFLNR